MDYVEDPVFRDIRREFLDEVAAIHAKHGFTDDWASLAGTLGLTVVEGPRNMYVSRGGSEIIFLDRSESGPRRNYSFAHEIAHYLFRATKSAFQAVLKDMLHGAQDGLDYEVEEALCHEAAALLIFPDHHLREAVLSLGVSPAAVFHLATVRGGSFRAAIIRLLGTLDARAWGYVVGRDHRSEFTWTNTKYRPGIGTLIEADHPLRAAWDETVETKANLPLKVSRRPWRMTMRAAAHGNRLVALFANRFPDIPSRDQQPLFQPGV